MMHTQFAADAAPPFEARRRGRAGEFAALQLRRAAPALLLGAALVAGCCAIMVLALVAGLYLSRPRLDAQSRAFAEASVDALASHWSEDELLTRAGPDFASTSSGYFYRYLAKLHTLGPGSRRQACLGSTAVSPMSVVAPVTATYACALEVEASPAVAVVSLRREGKAWAITGFYLSTPALR